MIYDEMAMSNGVIFQHAVEVLNTQMNVGLANKLLKMELMVIWMLLLSYQ